jgi:uncharacterized membrane protein
MTFYELLLLLHVAAAIVWLGAGFLMHVLAHRAERADDPIAMGALLTDMGSLADRLFIPASLIVLLAGIGLTIDGPWSFGDLWIVLALAGYAITFVTGAGILGPRTQRIGPMLESGTAGPSVLGELKAFFAVARLDFLVLVLILVTMVVKPTGDDVAVLVGMALVLAVGVLWTVSRARAAMAAVPAPGQA